MADITVTNSGTITSDHVGVEIVSFDLNASVIVTNEPGASIHAVEQALQITAMTLNANGTGTWLIDNGGLMESTGDGFAAIDLRALIAAGGTITVSNGAAGIIRAAGDDAIAAGTNTTVSNHGQIIAFDGNLVNSDGIDFGTHAGGRVDNFSDGTITGARYGITGDQALIVNNFGSITGGDGAGIGAFGGSTIANMGTITAANGFAIDAGFGDFVDTITNQGSILGKVFTGGGNDVLTIYTGSSISGQSDGGTGTDTLNLLGTGAGTLADVLDFEDLNTQAGTWTIVDAESFNGGITISAGATLQVGNGGTTGALSGDVADNGVLTFDRSDAVTFADVISGSGVVEQVGTGTTTLSGHNSYAGGTEIFAGTLDVATTDGAGTGAIAFEAGAQTLRIEESALSAGHFANTIDGFSNLSTVDLAGIGLATGATLGAGNLLTISGGAVDPITLQLDPTQSFAGEIFTVTSDGAGGTNVTLSQIISGGTSNNVVSGTVGNDIITAGSGNETINGLQGNDSIAAGSGNDTIIAGNGNNTITGDTGNDTVNAGNGNNTITGGAGNDVLAAGNGNNALDGGAGNDTLIVGTGNNTLSGGTGNNLFEFGLSFGNDVINDFNRGDQIEFARGLFHNFQAVQAASHQVGADTVISLGTNQSITLIDVSLNSLHASDFILH